jgi:hypothetical protein
MPRVFEIDLVASIGRARPVVCLLSVAVPSRSSRIAAAILGGVDSIWMKPGSKVLYLGAASGTSVSHVSDLVGEEGTVYAVEFSHRSGRDLINVAKKRANIIPIIEDARHPQKYRMLIGMVDCVFADVAQPDQVRRPSECVSLALGDDMVSWCLCHIPNLSCCTSRVAAVPLFW